MNKFLIIGLLLIVFIEISISAGGLITPTPIEKDLEIDAIYKGIEPQTIITNNLDGIYPTDVACDKSECWYSLKKEGLINTQGRFACKDCNTTQVQILVKTDAEKTLSRIGLVLEDRKTNDLNITKYNNKKIPVTIIDTNKIDTNAVVKEPVGDLNGL